MVFKQLPLGVVCKTSNFWNAYRLFVFEKLRSFVNLPVGVLWKLRSFPNLPLGVVLSKSKVPFGAKQTPKGKSPFQSDSFARHGHAITLQLFLLNKCNVIFKLRVFYKVTFWGCLETLWFLNTCLFEFVENVWAFKQIPFGLFWSTSSFC